MRAIAKSRPAPGVEIIDVDEPAIRAGCVKVRVEHGSICGTDLHIYNWDAWSAGRIRPPRVIGHEFCGTIVEVGEGVTDRRVGDFVASESHIVCGQCRQCLNGQGHVCVNTVILGVDVDGGFAPFAVIPSANARPVPEAVPRRVASLMDALGNAVHTVMAGPVEGRTVLITGMGPIGLFAAAICKALGAAKVYATEVSPYRIGLAEKAGADTILNPSRENAGEALRRMEPGGVDATLEMSGHPSSLPLALEHTRPGGRVSLLGVFPDVIDCFDLNKAIFKGLDLQGIVGRRLYATWDQMNWLLSEKGLDVTSVITNEMPFSEIEQAMQTLKAGQAGKIVLSFE
ncbi:MAG TPA: L-threonine 3-dehydrogenase [Fimbriimonadaceae bacterium]|nr:L-threonine 3-dehydrogenase [Fimbriimonadaceae bacterium]HRJ95988.1 L-threonine 3-dehydrogenase [Fimbriimonadaceae bacterium]